MEQAIDGVVDEKPLWRRIVDFPLVAMVIAVMLYVVAGGVASTIATQVPQLKPPIARTLFNSALVLTFFLVAYKLTIVRLGERPRDDLPARGALSNLGMGLLGGFLTMAASVGVAAIAGVYKVVGEGDANRLIYELVVVAIMPAFTEELLFRGILFRWIEEFGGSWAALLVTSALFGLVHIMNPNATWFSSFAIALEAGVLLGGAYMLTRSLWMPMGLHAAWNFTQGEVFDVPVSGNAEHGLLDARLSGPPLLSGGGFGLEASLICLVLATVTGIWFVWRAVRRGELVQPWWVRRRIA